MKGAALWAALSGALQTGPSCDAEPQKKPFSWVEHSSVVMFESEGEPVRSCASQKRSAGCRSWKRHPESTTHMAEPEQHQQAQVYRSCSCDCNFLVALSWTSPVLRGTEGAGKTEDRACNVSSLYSQRLFKKRYVTVHPNQTKSGNDANSTRELCTCICVEGRVHRV